MYMKALIYMENHLGLIHMIDLMGKLLITSMHLVLVYKQEGQGLNMVITVYVDELMVPGHHQESIHTIMISWQGFPRYLPFVRGIHRSPVDSPHKGPVMWPFDILFDVSLNKPLNKQPSWHSPSISIFVWRVSNCLWFEMPWCSGDITVTISKNSRWNLIQSSSTSLEGYELYIWWAFRFSSLLA